MTIFDDASVMVAVADYAAVDGVGKANAIGLGFTIAATQPNGFSAPQFVLAFVDVPQRYSGDTVDLTLELRNLTDDHVVQMQGPAGTVEALRVTQQATLQPPVVQGITLGRDMPIRLQINLGFPAGLPLSQGKTYAWKLQIDGRSRASWRAVFHVPAAPAGPIYGGPAGPADIPNVEQIHPDTPEPED